MIVVVHATRTHNNQVYGSEVDAATLQPLASTDHFVTALDGAKFKTDNFRCAHTGAELFGVQFFEVVVVTTLIGLHFYTFTPNPSHHACAPFAPFLLDVILGAACSFILFLHPLALTTLFLLYGPLPSSSGGRSDLQRKCVPGALPQLPRLRPDCSPERSRQSQGNKVAL